MHDLDNINSIYAMTKVVVKIFAILICHIYPAAGVLVLVVLVVVVVVGGGGLKLSSKVVERTAPISII
jgi:hypothetical protein